MAAVAVLLLVIAIVEANQVAGGGRALLRFGKLRLRGGGHGFQAFDQPLRGFHAPVAGQVRPHHRAHALALGDLDEPRAANAEGWPEPAGRGPGDFLDRIAAAMEFFAGVLAPAEEQVRVRVGVIADEVAAGGDFFCEVRALADKFADSEERGFYVVSARTAPATLA